jgi:hypothetical protein
MNSLIAPGSSVDTSDTLELTVLPLRQSALRESAPVIEEAVDGILDLTQFVGDATVTLGNRESGVAAWPLIAAGQRVWLRAAGRRLDGSNWNKVLLSAHVVTSAEVILGCSATLDRTTLENLADDGEITVSGAVNFARDSVEADAIVFPATSYRLLKGPSVIRVNFEGVPAQHLRIGSPVTLPDGAGAMTLIAGEAYIYLSRGNPPFFSGYVLFLNKLDVTVSFALSGVYRSIRMGTYRNAYTALTASFYDKAGALITTVAGPDAAQGEFFDYQSSGRPFSRVHITGTNMVIDNITFTR